MVLPCGIRLCMELFFRLACGTFLFKNILLNILLLLLLRGLYNPGGEEASINKRECIF